MNSPRDKIAAMRLWQRANGVWHIIFPGDRRESLKTRDEAKAKKLFHKRCREIMLGEAERLNGKTITLGKFATEYLEARDKMARSTVRNDTAALDHLKATLGEDTTLRTISPRDVEMFRVGMLKGLSPVSVNAYMRHLKAAFTKAGRWGYLKKERNPFLDLPPLLEQARSGPPVVQEVLEGILKAATGEERRMVMILLRSGLRPFELCKLQYHIHVVGGWIRLAGKRGRLREIPVSGELKELVGEGKRGEYVIQWRHPSTISHIFRKLATAAGYPGVRLYDCRHTFATMMLAAGADLLALQNLMGHSDLKTTRRYAKISRAHLENMMAKIDGAFGTSDNSLTPPGQVIEMKRHAK